MTTQTKNSDEKRIIVIPGEIIAEGEDFLPGEGTEKIENKIVALRYGLLEEQNKLARVIPLSGVYIPRRGNVVLGTVEMITGNGWVIDIGASENAFLPLSEVPRFVNKNSMHEVMQIGDTVVAKIWSINGRGIDLSIKGRGFGKADEGIVMKINPNKVPRVIGKEGSMINLIKDNTDCNITVGQNGFVLIQGDKIDNELLSRRAIEFIVEKSYILGLTEEVIKWFAENKK